MKDLTPEQVIFLDWLMDPRPQGRGFKLDPETGLVAADSPVKGVQATLAAQIGVPEVTLSRWRKTPQFKEAYRKAVEAEVSDPTYMLEIIRHVREVASGAATTEVDGILIGPKAADELKAAELYSRLTGYVVPELKKSAVDPTELTDEELEAALEASKKPPKLKVV